MARTRQDNGPPTGDQAENNSSEQSSGTSAAPTAQAGRRGRTATVAKAKITGSQRDTPASPTGESSAGQGDSVPSGPVKRAPRRAAAASGSPTATKAAPAAKKAAPTAARTGASPKAKSTAARRGRAAADAEAAPAPRQGTAARAPRRKTAAESAAPDLDVVSATQPVEPAPTLPPQAPRAAAPVAPDGPELIDPENPLTAPGLPDKLAENITRIETLGQRLLRALAQRPNYGQAIEGPGPELYGSVAQAWLKMATEQPARLIEQQVRYWGETLRHVAEAQGAFVQGLKTAAPDASADRRFTNPLWHTNPFYNFVMRQYHINAEALRKAADELDIESDTERRRVEWFTRQMIDMLAPTNFLATNPDALVKAIETEGASLVRGLENLVRDVEHNRGELIVTLSDRDAFRVGEDIGATPGEVVHRTRLFELIQYRPTTAEVYKTPLIVFPPWINKYYIMDLKPQNSLLHWLVGQGYTLFVVSWKNPDASFADISMDDYVAAYLEATDKALELTGEQQLNAVGYCIAGTTLAATLGLLKQRGDQRIKSACFLTTLTDFSDQGEFTTFLQDDFLGGIEDEVRRSGYLSAKLMQRTFSFLRANDLIWGPAIRSYMLGETPPAFDLLYWNGDGTNLPGPMVMQYLRQLCQANALATDGFEILGHRVHLSDVTVPLCAIACESDHIAPWMHSWRGIAQMAASDKTFILSESGHIAGIINPPGRVKYGHYVSDAGFEGSAADWKSAAQFHQGSWWGRWGEWLAGHSGPKVAAREPAPALGPAPGTYVLEHA